MKSRYCHARHSLAQYLESVVEVYHLDKSVKTLLRPVYCTSLQLCAWNQPERSHILSHRLKIWVTLAIPFENHTIVHYSLLLYYGRFPIDNSSNLYIWHIILRIINHNSVCSCFNFLWRVNTRILRQAVNFWCALAVLSDDSLRLWQICFRDFNINDV